MLANNFLSTELQQHNIYQFVYLSCSQIITIHNTYRYLGCKEKKRKRKIPDLAFFMIFMYIALSVCGYQKFKALCKLRHANTYSHVEVCCVYKGFERSFHVRITFIFKHNMSDVISAICENVIPNVHYN